MNTPAQAQSQGSSPTPQDDGMNCDDIVIRKAHAADVAAVQAFVSGLSPATRALRFFAPVAELPPMLARALEESDPRHQFLIARRIPGQCEGEGAGEGAPGAGRCAGEGAVVALAQFARFAPPSAECEVAVVIADDWQGRGLGRRIMLKLLSTAAEQGLQFGVGEVLRQNRPMLRLAQRIGFRLQRHPEDARLVQIKGPTTERPMVHDLLAA